MAPGGALFHVMHDMPSRFQTGGEKDNLEQVLICPRTNRINGASVRDVADAKNPIRFATSAAALCTRTY